MFLLDTNICIYLMKNRFSVLTEKFMQTPSSELAVSAVTVFELEYGAAKSKWGTRKFALRANSTSSAKPNLWRTLENLRLFLSGFEIVPFDASDAVKAGQIRAFLESRGLPIGVYDLEIAAQGLARGYTVVTHNTGEFSRVPGLVLEDWTV